ncbi:MAG TPA: TetR family transcriptional regulator [Jatrophihabitans sp.]|jgi:AcrR family transcriptional regulator
MADTVKARRSYDSSRRREQARDTRLRILRAAHDLFVAQGYGRTTIADIARAAQVSSETIYTTFKNKATLLHKVWDVTIGGDDQDVQFHDRPEIQAIRGEPDLARRFVLHARMSTVAAGRTAPFLLALRGAAASEPTAAAMLAEVDRQRADGLGVMAREAAATGRLKVSEAECLDLIWATTDGTLWHRLVKERGWSEERYADHLAAMWIAALVQEPLPDPS